MSYTGAVEAAKRTLAPPELVIDLQNRRILAAGQIVKLEPAALALLSLFARRRLEGLQSEPAPNKEVAEPEWAGWFLEEYEQIKGDWVDSDATRNALRNGMDGAYFSSCKSKLHRKLNQALGPNAHGKLIHDGGFRPDTKANKTSNGQPGVHPGYTL